MKGIAQGSDRSAVNDVRVTSCSSIFFWVEKRFAGIVVTSAVLKIVPFGSQKTCRMNTAIKLQSRILKFWKILQIEKKTFFPKFPKIDFSKTGIRMKEYVSMNMCTECQVAIFKSGWVLSFLNAKKALFTLLTRISIFLRFLHFVRFGPFKKAFQGIFCVLDENLT